MKPPVSRVKIEPLEPQHDRSGFQSGVEALDRYLTTQASQDARKHMAAPFVLVLADGSLAGYYTISSTLIVLATLPIATTKKLLRYPHVPATLIGRLAVDQRYRGQGHGRFLLAEALYRAANSEIASFAVIVDAKYRAARSFYERESFLPFPDQPQRLFLPMVAIKKLFG